jgi:5-methyltetrahydrofolate--homocysteine methyltransferase
VSDDDTAPERARAFRRALACGPLLLDAAQGTRLIARGLDPRRDDPALWNLSQPSAVADIHRRDAEAGADVIVTNTFGANRAWLARYDLEEMVGEINRRAVELARRAAGADRFVIGSIGPSAADKAEAYAEQAIALDEAGVDALLFETHRLDQAETALRSVCGLSSLPLLVSLVTWPDALAGAADRLAAAGASALGSNCQPGMESMVTLASRLRDATALPLLVKPSAGLPGSPPASPESFAQAVPALLALGVRLLGGCCGTTEAHVAALRVALDAARPRPPARAGAGPVLGSNRRPDRL